MPSPPAKKKRSRSIVEVDVTRTIRIRLAVIEETLPHARLLGELDRVFGAGRLSRKGAGSTVRRKREYLKAIRRNTDAVLKLR